MGDRTAIEWTALWWLVLLEAAYSVMAPKPQGDDSASRRRWAETPAEGWGNLLAWAWKEVNA